MPKSGDSVSLQTDNQDIELEMMTRVFVFFKGAKNTNIHQQDQIFSTEDILLPISNFKDFKLSLTQVVLWSNIQVYYMNLRTLKLNSLRFLIRKEDEQINYIRKVDMSGVIENRCVITMRQSDQVDSIVFWKMDSDIELDAFACSHRALIFFDSRGFDYILDEEFMIIVRMSSRC